MIVEPGCLSASFYMTDLKMTKMWTAVREDRPGHGWIECEQQKGELL